MTLLFEEQTEQLIRGFFIIQNEVGLGRHEAAYQNAYALWAKEQSLPVISKPGLSLRVGNREATVLYPDFLVWNQIYVELKAVPRMLGPAEDLQLFNYFRASNIQLGLLVNLGLDRVHFERRIYTPLQTTISEDWTHWVQQIDGQDRDIGAIIRNSLRMIYELHRTGYSLEVTEKLLLAAFEEHGLRVVVRPSVKAIFRDQVVHESAIDCFVIEDRFGLTLSSQFDNCEYTRSLGMSCLKTLSLPWGLAVNFGLTELQILALRHPHLPSSSVPRPCHPCYKKTER